MELPVVLFMPYSFDARDHRTYAQKRTHNRHDQVFERDIELTSAEVIRAQFRDDYRAISPTWLKTAVDTSSHVPNRLVQDPTT